MQIGAINSNIVRNNVNFKGEQQEIPTSLVLSQEDQAAVDVLDKVVSKVNSNVHPATIIGTVLTTIATAAAGIKFIPVVRKAAFKGAELVTRGITKAGGEIANVFKKDKLQLKEIDGKITEKFKGAYSDNSGSTKVLKFLKKQSTDILGEETTQKIEHTLRKAFHVKSDLGLIDTGLAVVAAGITVDPVSDGLEEHHDAKDIANAAAGIVEVLGA